MSAYIVGTDLIDLIVSAAVTGQGHDLSVWNHTAESYHRWNMADADELGQLLHDANVASVNYRYRENTPADVYTFRRVADLGGITATWGDVLRALDCFDYQSCEVPDYHTTLASYAIAGIRRKVTDRLVSGMFPDAHWSWSRDVAGERLQAARDAMKAGAQ